MFVKRWCVLLKPKSTICMGRLQKPQRKNLRFSDAQVPTGALKFVPPASKPGDYIVMEALMDVVMAFSACPQDVLPINGTGTAEARLPIFF